MSSQIYLKQDDLAKYHSKALILYDNTCQEIKVIENNSDKVSRVNQSIENHFKKSLILIKNTIGSTEQFQKLLKATIKLITSTVDDELNDWLNQPFHSEDSKDHKNQFSFNRLVFTYQIAKIDQKSIKANPPQQILSNNSFVAPSIEGFHQFNTVNNSLEQSQTLPSNTDLQISSNEIDNHQKDIQVQIQEILAISQKTFHNTVNLDSKLQIINLKLDPQQQSTALKTEKETQKSKSISKLTDQDYQQDSVMKEKVRQKVNSKSYDSSDKSIEENKSQFQSRNSYNNPKRLNSQEDKQSQVNNPYDKSFEHSQSFKHQNDLSMENKGFQLSNQNYERRKSLQNADTNLQKIELPINQIVKESYIVASQQDNQKELNKSIEKYITASSLQNSLEIISIDPKIQNGLKKVNKPFQEFFSNCKESQQLLQLKSDKKQTILDINLCDGNVLMGQNDVLIQTYNSQDFSYQGDLQISSEPISILIHLGYIYLGLNNEIVAVYDQKEYKLIIEIKTKQVPMKILPYMNQDFKNDLECQYLLFLEKDGFIEIFSILQLKILFSHQHSCGMSIQDAIQVANKNQVCLGFAQLIDNVYKDGKLAFVEIKIQNDDDQRQNLKQLNQIQKQQIRVKELSEEDNFIQQSVFCVQQISLNCFVVCVIDKNIKIFNRLNPKAIKDIINPSTSINYNALRKIDGFGDKLPYLLFRDSRSIGIINCSTLDAQTILEKSNYSRCGNIYCLEQKRETDGKLSIYTYTYDRDKNKRELLKITIKLQKHI